MAIFDSRAGRCARFDADKMMSRYVRWIVVGAMVMAAGVAPASAQTACDKACLRTMLDQYLAAVVKHDPAAAPLVVGFRQT